MIHQHDQSGHSRTQHSRRSRRRRAGRSPRRPVVVASLSVVAVVAGGVVANEVASAIRTPQRAAAATTEVSLWSEEVRPKRPADSDTRSVEVGTSFRATQAGAVTGIRFYKYQQNTGRHTGSLWNDRGTLLASVTFQNESLSGWQTARLSSPVPLDVGRWYVVSYHAPEGRYAADPNSFRYQMLTSGVLQARSSVYAYGSEARYPTHSWRSASYYADVLFVSGGTATTEPSAPAPTTASSSPSRTPTSTPPPSTHPPSPAPTTSTSSPTSTKPAPSPTLTQPPAYTCTTSADKGRCGPYDDYAGITGTTSSTYVGNNVWSPVPGARQTLSARDPGTWQVTANMPAGNTSVVSYPSIGLNLGQITNVPTPLSSYASIFSSFGQTMNATARTSAWASYDIWVGRNGCSDCASNEVMIQHDFAGNGDCDSVASATFGGSGGVPVQAWHLCKYGSELIWKLGADEQHKVSQASGRVDILAMLNWLVDHRYLPTDSGLWLIGYGWEICSTGGTDERFVVNEFSLNATVR